MQAHHHLLIQVPLGNFRAIARAISVVENDITDYQQLLAQLPRRSPATPVIGITGPPGAGKSTLVNALITALHNGSKRVAVVAVDPSSPFNYGALLGDRIRWAAHYNNPHIYIRSLATRGSLGGLSHKIIEIMEVLQAAPFDYILLETVGVGQSEVEVAGLADTTIVVLVPEAGDEVQTMKAGLMEIADIFVVNKADRPDADRFAQHLYIMLHERPASTWDIPIVKTIADKGVGIGDLCHAIAQHQSHSTHHQRRAYLLAQRAMYLIQQHRMRDINAAALQQHISTELQRHNDAFNLYRFLEKNYHLF